MIPNVALYLQASHFQPLNRGGRRCLLLAACMKQHKAWMICINCNILIQVRWTPDLKVFWRSYIPLRKSIQESSCSWPPSSSALGHIIENTASIWSWGLSAAAIDPPLSTSDIWWYAPPYTPLASSPQSGSCTLISSRRDIAEARWVPQRLTITWWHLLALGFTATNDARTFREISIWSRKSGACEELMLCRRQIHGIKEAWNRKYLCHD